MLASGTQRRLHAITATGMCHGRLCRVIAFLSYRAMTDAPPSDRRPGAGAEPAAFESTTLDSRLRGNDRSTDSRVRNNDDSIDAESILARLAERRSCRAFDGSSMPREVVEAIMQ